MADMGNTVMMSFDTYVDIMVTVTTGMTIFSKVDSHGGGHPFGSSLHVASLLQGTS
jgi:hypothetical protein